MPDLLPLGYQLSESYEVVRVLSSRQWVNTYLVEDTARYRTFVLKEFFLPEDEELTEELGNFLDYQAEVLAGLDHPGLPKLEEILTEEDRIYLVMEYIEGIRLKEYIDKRLEPLTEIIIRNWIAQLCEIVGYLHLFSSPLVLGTLTPANVVITPLGKAKLFDYGDESFFPQVYEDEEYVKEITPYYSPDQTKGEELTTADDIYALGAICYFCLTREAPSMYLKPSSLSSYREDISLDFCELIAKAMHPEPGERYLKVQDLQAELVGKMDVYNQPRMEISPENLEFKNIHRGRVLTGKIAIKNVGGGELSCVVRPREFWLRVNPDIFQANFEEVSFWIDSSQLQKGRAYQDFIDISSREEVRPFKVTVSLLPPLIKRLNPLLGSFLLLIPTVFIWLFVLGFLGFAEKKAETFYRQKVPAFQGFKLSTPLEIKALSKTPLAYMAKFNTQFAHFFLFLIPILAPLFIGRIFSSFTFAQRRIIQIFYYPALLSPSILLVILMLKLPYDGLFATQADLQYLSISHSLIPFIGINLATAVYFGLPEEKRQPKAFKQQPRLALYFWLALVLIYLSIIMRYVIF